MDLSVLGAALAAHRGGGRPTGEIEAELLFESVAELVAFQFVEERAERRPVGQLGDRKAPALGNIRIIRIDPRARLGPHEPGHDQVLEWLAGERNGAEGVEIEAT